MVLLKFGHCLDGVFAPRQAGDSILATLGFLRTPQDHQRHAEDRKSSQIRNRPNGMGVLTNVRHDSGHIGIDLEYGVLLPGGSGVGRHKSLHQIAAVIVDIDHFAGIRSAHQLGMRLANQCILHRLIADLVAANLPLVSGINHYAAGIIDFHLDHALAANLPRDVLTERLQKIELAYGCRWRAGRTPHVVQVAGQQDIGETRRYRDTALKFTLDDDISRPLLPAPCGQPRCSKQQRKHGSSRRLVPSGNRLQVHVMRSSKARAGIVMQRGTKSKTGRICAPF